MESSGGRAVVAAVFESSDAAHIVKANGADA